MVLSLIFCIVICSTSSLLSFNQDYVSFYQLKRALPSSATINQCLNQLQTCIEKTSMNTSHIPLFRTYPNIQNKVPYISLGNLSTPIIKLEHLGAYIDTHNLYMKCDNLTGKKLSNGCLFGGNKVRKLEFLLADALQHNAPAVLTFGCAGSNHVVATAAYAHELGIPCIAMLKPQPNSLVVQNNLLRMHAYGADIHMSKDSIERALKTIDICTQYKKNNNRLPYIIPTGGSSPLGIIGFVNAAYELHEQIQASTLPTPDIIYVATGSCGTIAGLMLGIKALNLNTRIIGVCVELEDNPGTFKQTITKLFYQTNMLLHTIDQSFPLVSLAPNDIELIHDFAGQEYGLCTPEGTQAATLMHDKEGINLEGTYTAKTLAALLNDIQKNDYQNKIILFWNTYSIDDYIPCATLNYKELPPDIHAYFESPTPLDDVKK